MNLGEIRGIDPTKIEKKEHEPEVCVEVLNTDELEQMIEQGNAELKRRMKSPEDGGAFTYFFPDITFDHRMRDRSMHVVVNENGNVVGIGKLTKMINQTDVYEIAAVSVDPEFQGRGYARKMLEEMFRLAREKHWTLVSSGYSTDGKEKLEKIDRELAEKYQVTFFDENKWATHSMLQDFNKPNLPL